MRLSLLQRYIVKESLKNRAASVSKKDFFKFYDGKKNKPKNKDLQNIVTKSLERLIAKEYLSAEGRKTSHKLFINTVRLTLKGKKLAKKLLGEQQILPLRLKKKL